MKKIIFVTLTLANAGAERVSSLLINYWLQQGYDVTVVQTEGRDTAANFPTDSGVHYLFVESKSRFMPLKRIEDALGVAKILKKNPDAVGIAFIRRAILTLAIAAALTGSRYIVSERNDPRSVPKGGLAKRIRNLAFAGADACVFQTEEAMAYFPPRIRKKGRVIPNPINPALPPINRGARKNRVLALCRLSPQKNLGMLLRAFASIAEDFPAYTLEIYGKGPEEGRLREQIRALHMEERIFLRGFSSDVFRELNDAALYVSSSDYEGISNAMLEALAMGLPVIATDCPAGGARMVIENGVNGLLVPVGDEKRMAEALAALLSDRQKAERMARAAEAVRSRYRIEQIGDAWLSVIASVADRA